MKRNAFLILILLLVVTGALLFAACGNVDNETVNDALTISNMKSEIGRAFEGVAVSDLSVDSERGMITCSVFNDTATIDLSSLQIASGTLTIDGAAPATLTLAEGENIFLVTATSGTLSVNYTLKITRKDASYVDPSHTHTYSDAWSKDDDNHWHAATCGHDVKKDLAEHTWQVSYTIPATDAAAGVTIYACSVCGATKNEVLPKVEHTHTYAVGWSHDDFEHWHPATCGHDEKKDLAPHTWDAGIVTTPATEDSEGVKTYTCSVCRATKTESIGRLQHTHTFASTWSHDDVHHWHAATCGHDVKQDYAEHDFDEIIILVEPTETVEGIVSFTCNVCHETIEMNVGTLLHEHAFAEEWSHDSTYHWHAATCGHEVKEDIAEHTWGEGVITTPATEEVEGIMTYTCTVCSATRTRNLGTLGHVHNYGDWQHFRIATCKEEGEDRRYCSCEEYESLIVAVDPDNHDYTPVVTPPTCAEGGYTTYTCSRCGASYVADETDPTDEHSWEWIVDVEPAERIPGVMHEECSVCHTKRNEDTSVEALPCTHAATHVAYDMRSEAADKATFLTLTLCDDCGDTVGQAETAVTFPSATASYDGTPHSMVISLSALLPEGFSVLYEGNGQHTPGDHTVTATFIDQQGEPFDVTVTATLHIVKDGSYHEVTFIYDDGETPSVTIAVADGSAVAVGAMPSIPDKTGYNGYWLYDGAPITEDADISVAYSPITYTITYVLPEDSTNNPLNPTSYTIESATLSLRVPVSGMGLSFQGWYTTEDYLAGTRVTSIAAGSTGDKTLYGKFLYYRVESAEGFAFDYEHYEYPALTMTVSSIRGAIALSSAITVSTGCTWTLSYDIEGEDLIATKNMSLAEGHNYAYVTVWYEEEYNLVYYLDIYRLGFRTYAFRVDGEVIDCVHEASEQSYITPPPAPEKEGYTFLGWCTEEKEGYLTFPYILCAEDVANESLRLAHRRTSYVFYIDAYYSTKASAELPEGYSRVTFCYADGEAPVTLVVEKGAVLDPADLPSIPSKKGYSASWLYYDTPIYGDTTISVSYEPIVYTITYVLPAGWSNSTGNPTEYTVEYPTMTLFSPCSLEGYAFQGWYSTPSVSARSGVTSIAAGSTGDITLYAKVIPYGIESADGFTFDYDNYDFPALTQIVASTRNTIALSSAILVSEGCTWTLSRDVEGASVIKTKSISLVDGHNYAYVTVLYDESHNFVYMIDIYRLGARKYAFRADGNVIGEVQTVEEQSLISAPDAPSKTGYTFVGWTCDDGYDEYLSFPYRIFAEDILYEDERLDHALSSYVFYIDAVFSPNRYSVTFDPAGGSVEKGAVDVVYDSAVTFIEPTLAGYTFKGWEDEAGTLWVEGSTWKYAREVTMTARWTLTIYDITYELYGGVNAENPATYTIESDDILYLAPTRAGYTFVGWFLDNDFLDGTTGISAGSYGAVTVYAKWEVAPEMQNYVFSSTGTTCAISGVRDSSITTAVIPDYVASIGTEAFRYCYKLVEVYNKSSLSITKGSTGNGYVGYYAKAVYTSEYVSKLSTSVDGYILYTDGDDVSLVGYLGSETDLTLPDSVTSINHYAFSGSDSLTSVTIGSGVTSIGGSAFYDCSGLASISVAEDNHKYHSAGNCLIETSSKTLLAGCKTSIIPDDGSVQSIGSYAFHNCSGLTSVTIPSSVTSIGNSAFSGCSSLVEMTIPFVGGSKSATSASSSTLFGYIFGTSSYTGGTGVRQYYTSSSSSTYYIPSSLRSVTVTGGNILYGAFYGCSMLTSVTIPDSVTSIGSYAFSGCSSLVEMTIPFVGGSKSATSASSSTLFGYIFGTSSYTGGTAVNQYYADSSYSTYYIPSSLRSVAVTGGNILYGAFYGCSMLTFVTIPDSVTSIGDKAFDGCSGLQYNEYDNALYLGDTGNPYVALIGAKYSSITTCIINDNTKIVLSSAFSGCISLTSVTIGSGVTSIGGSAFYDCSGLASITVAEDNHKYHSAGNCLIETSSKTLLAGCKTSIIPDDGSVKWIGSSAFYGCTGLTSITIPSSVKSIWSYAFAFCSGLTSVTIGNGVTSIGAYAFEYCSGLTSVTIPNSVTSIGEGVFSGCSSLVEMTIPFVGGSKSAYPASSDTLFGYIFGTSSYTGGTAVKQCYASTSYSSSYTTYYLPSSLCSVTVTDDYKILYGAFDGCSMLTSVTIGSGVNSIEQRAFYGCYKLVEVYNKSSLSITKGSSDNGYVGYYAKNVYKAAGNSKLSIDEDGYIFYTDGNAKIVMGYTGEQTELTIPSTATSIYQYAFYNRSDLTSVTIGSGVTVISNYAFKYCSGLTSVTIPDSVTSIREDAFRGCSGLTSVTIGNGVTSIGDGAFSYCSGLTSVTIGSGVKSIGSSAFSGCSGLSEIYYTGDVAGWCGISGLDGLMGYGSSTKSLYIGGVKVEGDLVIPDGVKLISSYAFYGCRGLTSVTIPDSVTSIGERAFRICTGLTSVTIGNSVTSIGAYAFYGCSGLTSVTIPNSVTSIGASAFSSCTGLTSVTIGSSVTSIGEDAFRYCYKLVEVYNKSSLSITRGSSDNGYVGYAKAIYMSDYVSKLSTTEDGYILYTDGNAKIVMGYTGDQSELTIPATATSIYQYAFYGCSGLTSVTIPDSVTAIPSYAFRGCSGLTSVTIGNGVTSIGEHAFAFCNGLTSVTIPDSVTNIGNVAFSNCSSLTSVTIPDSVTSIGSSAFSYCSGLTSIDFQGTKTQWNAISKGSYWNYNTGNYTIICTDGTISKS